jgi:hypothetical protein
MNTQLSNGKRFFAQTLAAGVMLALAFTLSCSSNGSNNDPGGNDPIVPNERIFHCEIGTVCVGYTNLFSTPLDNKYFIADGTDNYINMYSVCGDKMQSAIEGTEAEGTDWLNARNISSAIFNKINQELFVKGNSAFFGFYPAVDGYLRYLYIEEMHDGKGLLKNLATEEK